jgi:hypothetical protein
MLDEYRDRGEYPINVPIEQGLNGTSDTRQLEFARGQGRVLVTCHSDFLALANTRVPHAGIVFWTAKPRRLGQVVLDLALLSRVVTAEEMAGHVEFL